MKETERELVKCVLQLCSFLQIELDTCFKSLQKLEEGAADPEPATQLSMAHQELKEVDGQLTYKGHHIAKMTAQMQFVNAFKAYIQAIIQNLQRRYT